MKKVFAGFALALVLTGCSASEPATPESVGMEACDAFVYYAAKADSVADMDRKVTVEQVNYELTRHEGVVADEMLLDGRDILARSVKLNDAGWTLAADTFVGRCKEAGWTAK